MGEPELKPPKPGKAINRLKSMYPLRNVVNEAYLTTLMASQAGNPTAWSMLNWWEGDILLKAMDVEVVYPENYATIAASMGQAEGYLALADAEGFPAHLCGYARTTLGYTKRMMVDEAGRVPPDAPLGGMARPTLLVGAGTACDARYKWFQALGRYFDCPQWVLELPHLGVKEFQEDGAEEAAVRFVVAELRAFVAFLERLLGRKMDWAKLEAVVDLALKIQRVFHEVNELRKHRPCPMHSGDFWSAMPGCLFLTGHLPKVLELYEDMHREVAERVAQGVAGIAVPEKYRLLFAELPPWHSLKFFENLAERGWNFVVESYAYHPVVPMDLSAVSDPLERIARICMRFFHLRHRQAFSDGVSYAFVAPYLDSARTYRCDGAFLHPLLTCRTASAHLQATQDVLIRKLRVPSLLAEGDIVDIRLFNPERTLIQAEAFEATMDHYREERRQAGSDW